MTKPQIVTFLTDFGVRDPYVAIMKGIVLGMAPRAQLVDVTHEVPAHDVLAASFILAQTAPYFPKDTLHVVVVDPDVGTERKLLAARINQQTFLLPDNGVITFISQLFPMEELVVVRNTQFLPGEISTTFHGRDVLAPVAGHLLNGLDLRRLGPRPDTYKRLSLPEPAGNSDELVGQVLYIDGFGNIVSNISRNLVLATFDAPDRTEVWCGEQMVGPIAPTYGSVEPQKSLALINSMGLVELAVNRGSAAQQWGAKVGDRVRIVRRPLISRAQ